MMVLSLHQGDRKKTTGSKMETPQLHKKMAKKVESPVSIGYTVPLQLHKKDSNNITKPYELGSRTVKMLLNFYSTHQ
jgi:hypothetical protein